MLAARITLSALLTLFISTPVLAADDEARDDSIMSYLADFEKREETPFKLVGGFGMTIKSGNTELVNVAGNALFEKGWETFKLKLTWQSIYGEEDSIENASEHILTERIDWFIGKKSRLFQMAWLETDSDESLAYRFWIDFGYGMQLKKTDTFEWWLDFGAGWEFERYYGGTGQDAPFVLVQSDWDWQLTKALLYEQIIRWQQYFEDGGRFKLYLEARFSVPISEHWSFQLLIRDEYNSDPEPGNEDNDFTMILTLNFKFSGEEKKPADG